ncbi:MAG: LacI family DNA-binding transcriptional regulator [Pleomorphochaeta sp.]
MYSILDVAKLANVSKSTVSRVLSGNSYGVSAKTKEKVEKAAKELGYVKNSIASSLRTNQTKTIILIIPDITNNFWAEVARGAQDYLEKKGYSLILVNTDWEEDNYTKYLDLALTKGVDGILINTYSSSINRLKDIKIPIVLLGNAYLHSPYTRVGSNTLEGIREALEYLYENGHRKIGIVASHTDTKQSKKIENRLSVYNQFLESKNIEFNDNYYFSVEYSMKGGISLATSISIMDNPPTAILAGNDLIAIGLINESRKLDIKIPEDLSIIGVDDIPISSIVYPKLTTIAKPKREIGEKAAEAIINVINGKNVNNNYKLPVNLIIRETVENINK